VWALLTRRERLAGGSVGKTKDDLVHLMAFLTTILPDELPRHLLGMRTSGHADVERAPRTHFVAHL